jgi:hypothetical protein
MADQAMGNARPPTCIAKEIISYTDLRHQGQSVVNTCMPHHALKHCFDTRERTVLALHTVAPKVWSSKLMMNLW